MPRETNAAKRERAVEVCERLNRRYGPVECFLDTRIPLAAHRGAALGADDRRTGQQGDAEAVCPVAHARGHGGGERGRCGRYY